MLSGVVGGIITGQICPSGSFHTVEFFIAFPSRPASLGDLAEHSPHGIVLGWEGQFTCPYTALSPKGRHRSHSDKLVSTLKSVTQEPPLEVSPPPCLY